MNEWIKYLVTRWYVDWMEIIKVDSLLLVRAVKFYIIGFTFIYIKENEL